MIRFTVILLYLFSIFLISIIFKKYNKNNKEIVRKIIHIGIGPLIPIAQFLKISQNSALIFTGIMSFKKTLVCGKITLPLISLETVESAPC